MYPSFFWVHHGSNRLAKNLEMCEQIRPDLVLMAHSLELADRFPAEVRFFPFAVASDIFNCSTPLDQRSWDIAFVGSTTEAIYNHRRAVLKAIRTHFSGRANISLYAKVYVDKLAALYGNAKIVVNCAADQLRTINMRLFEGMGCGALVVTDLVPDQERLFKDGEHCVVYHDTGDLLGKLSYFLDHLDRAQEIATQGVATHGPPHVRASRPRAHDRHPRDWSRQGRSVVDGAGSSTGSPLRSQSEKDRDLAVGPVFCFRVGAGPFDAGVRGDLDQAVD